MQLASPFSFSAPRSYRIALCFFFFIQGFTFASWASRIPDIKTSLGLGDGMWGFVLLGLPIGQLTGMALSGYLVTRFSSKKVLTIAAFLYPLALTLLGLANSWPMLLFALFVFGICGNLFNISVNTQAVGIERLYRRSIIASFHGLWSLAGFFGGIVGAIIVSYAVPPFYHFCIVLGFACMPALMANKYLLPRDANSGGAKRKVFTKPEKGLLVLGMIAFACMICEGTMFDWSGVYFDTVVHAPQKLLRLGYIGFMSMMATGRLAADVLITRFGFKRMLQLSGCVISSGLLLSVALPYVATATMGFMLVGMGVSSVVPLTYSLAARTGKTAPGVAIASVSSVGFLGFLSGPPLIGFIAEAAGLRWSFTLIAFLGLGTTFLAGRINKMKPQQ